MRKRPNSVRQGVARLVFLLACVSIPVAAQEKSEKWLEIQSPNFLVVSDAGERQARRVAEEFEQFRAVFQTALPQARVDPGRPVYIIATRDQKTMRAWLPGFWEQEGAVRPSGIFVAGEDRHYAAVQVGVSGPSPYHNLYHEYVHLLNELNFGPLPAWLSEGLAEVYATAFIGERSVDLGRPDEGHLRLLRDNRPLPLETLLRVDHSSPNYNETEKASIFYAQSWALAHMLLFGEEGRRSQLENYLRRSSKGEDPVAAARSAFGDLKELEKNLLAYCRRPSFRLVSFPAPATVDPAKYSTREIPLAESHARRGDFLLQTHRPGEARLALEDALRVEENETLALEGLAKLSLMEDDRETAFLWLQRAAEAGSQSYLAHYYYAMLLAERATDPEQAEIAEEHLEKALALNPDFASAHAAISSFYVSRPSMMEDALAHAQRAVELKPEDTDFQVNLGNVLVRMQRFDEAVAVGEMALRRAATDEERQSAERFLAATRKYIDQLAAWREAEEQARKEAEERRKRKEAEILARAQEPPPPPPAQPTWGTGPRRRVTGSAVEGWLSSVACSGKTMEIQVNLGAYLLKLRSNDYFTMGFLAAGWTPPEDFDPCQHLKGRRAVVIYRAVEGKPYAGEVLAIQVQK